MYDTSPNDVTAYHDVLEVTLPRLQADGSDKGDCERGMCRGIKNEVSPIIEILTSPIF